MGGAYEGSNTCGSEDGEFVIEADVLNPYHTLLRVSYRCVASQ